MKVHFLILAFLTATGFLPNANGQNTPLPTIPSVDISEGGSAGSTYIPMDSWIYPALDRLHALGYLDTAFLGLRPWTRLSIANMLEQSADDIESEPGSDE